MIRVGPESLATNIFIGRRASLLEGESASEEVAADQPGGQLAGDQAPWSLIRSYAPSCGHGKRDRVRGD